MRRFLEYPPDRQVADGIVVQDDQQIDLSAEIDGQAAVSDILVGKRGINARQTKALATRFGGFYLIVNK
ncbi:MAG: hypothetical protein A2512_04425 [Deltaproteobacteria bacterium RIFOXYD12_FULL_56_24]|nr:MAG: hypothetical protein A2512_04425 [Deltaproteobacteria bacterium RIFOXYD12_FULL_56_24]